MSSSHTETPAPDSCPRTSTDIATSPPPVPKPDYLPALGQTVCTQRLPARGNAKLLVELAINVHPARKPSARRDARCQGQPEGGRVAGWRLGHPMAADEGRT